MTRILLWILVAGVALASGVPTIDGPTVDWSVIGGGGGHGEAAPYSLDGTIGQAVVGVASNPADGLSLCSGFWCGIGAYHIYLPLILRGY